ncbi:MAG TPA: hypothetical protein EYP59_18630 [Thiotrichaceae bacterium]|nr:hypothetical protein [Thiotrichaceae bacterium]
MIPFHLIRHLNVAHHVKGRIRFRILSEALNYLSQMDTHEITTSIRSVPGIDDVRINPNAASIIIYYNPHQIQPKWWEQLIRSSERDIPHLLAEMTGQYA